MSLRNFCLLCEVFFEPRHQFDHLDVDEDRSIAACDDRLELL